jgi:hypothetical protein
VFVLLSDDGNSVFAAWCVCFVGNASSLCVFLQIRLVFDHSHYHRVYLICLRVYVFNAYIILCNALSYRNVGAFKAVDDRVKINVCFSFGYAFNVHPHLNLPSATLYPIAI